MILFALLVVLNPVPIYKNKYRRRCITFIFQTNVSSQLAIIFNPRSKYLEYNENKHFLLFILD